MFPRRPRSAFGIPAILLVGLAVFAALPATRASEPEPDSKPRFVDLSLLVAPEWPCTWPAPIFHPFRLDRYLQIGPASPYNGDILAIDENTGTQLDAPAHSVPPPGANFPNAGPWGEITGDKIPAWQLCGEACVVDCTALRDTIARGESPLIRSEHLQSWEAEHRTLGPGDVVLLASGYSDRYYQPFPAGRRFLAEPLEGAAPAWPAPDAPCMEFFVGRKVMALAIDSPTMGALPPKIGADAHLAGLRHGMIWTEGAIGLAELPATGAFYCMLGVKHAGGAGAEGRAFAIVGSPLADRLIASARKKQVVDLSVTLDEMLPVVWPGAGAGNHRYPYLTSVLLTFEQTQGNGFAQTHLFDSHTGTHLVPPAYALPSAKSDTAHYGPQVREWLAAYEQQYGPRGTSDRTTEVISLEQTCGPARVIDVQQLIGTTKAASWPASPEITRALIEQYEQQSGALQPGEIVIFRSGWSDRYCQPGPQSSACMADPLNGKSEGWPAPGPEAVHYLAEKGIRCIATDAPALGGADPRMALWTYWAMGSKDLVGVEYLTNLADLPTGAYFLFAAPKIEGCHGGPGRAIALY